MPAIFPTPMPIEVSFTNDAGEIVQYIVATAVALIQGEHLLFLLRLLDGSFTTEPLHKCRQISVDEFLDRTNF